MPRNRIKYRNKIHKRKMIDSYNLTTPFLYCLVVVISSITILLVLFH